MKTCWRVLVGGAGMSALLLTGGLKREVVARSDTNRLTRTSMYDAPPSRAFGRRDVRVVMPSTWREAIRAARVQFAARRDLQTDDGGASARLTADVLARITDSNTAAFARSLTAEEANTPTGLAVLDRWLRLDAMAAAQWIAVRGEGSAAEALAIARTWAADGDTLCEYCD